MSKWVKTQNYPKVCFGCNRPHINCDPDEVVSEDGTKSFHKDCYKEETVELEAPEFEKVELEAPETTENDLEVS